MPKYFKAIPIILQQLLFFVIANERIKGMNYILLWPSANRDPFNTIEMGRDAFVNRDCPYRNCFLTNDTAYFPNLTEFEVIVFNAQNLQGKPKSALNLPNHRTNKQLYIFFSNEPAEYYPLNPEFEGYFNLTWTYRLDSNTTIPFFVITDPGGTDVYGPKKNVRWKDPKKLKPIFKKIKRKLKHKKTAAAWFVSDCVNPKNNRKLFAESLKIELANYGHRLDIYGECGNLQCHKQFDDCDGLIKRDYYFYLAFENSFCTDYVTEKVLHGLQNYAIPIVYGGANYSSFLAPYMYINARNYGPLKLAEKMHDLIINRPKFEEYFKWHSEYQFRSTAETAYRDELCDLCDLINDVLGKKVSRVFPHIVKWWNGSVEIPTKSIYDVVV